MRLPKVKYGDVFQILLSNGYGYIQCVQEATKTECEIIRVLPGVYDKDGINDINKAITNKELFFLQLPVKYAVKQNLLKFIGNFFVPLDCIVPRFFRTQHIVGTDFIGWHIIDSETLQFRLTKKLTKEEKHLSQWGVLSIPDIAEKIETNWIPEDWD